MQRTGRRGNEQAACPIRDMGRDGDGRKVTDRC